MGDSYGAKLAIESLAKYPELFRCTFLMSLNALPNQNIKFPACLNVYHGKQDPVMTPSQAFSYVLGKTEPDKAKINWHIFEREGHSYYRLESWALIASDIIEKITGRDKS